MSNRKIFTIVILLAALLGAATIYFLTNKPPQVSAIKNNPALFNIADYPDTVRLHTRLSTLFPRGTPRDTVQSFFKRAGTPQTGRRKFSCTFALDYTDMSFFFDTRRQELIAIQIENWPERPPEQCKPQAPLTPSAPTKPKLLKLEDLD